MFIVLSLVALYLFLLGCAIGTCRIGRGRMSELTGLSIFAGLLVNYSLTLAGLQFRFVWMIGAAAALVGLLRFARQLRTVPRTRPATRLELFCVVAFIAYILALYYLQVLSEPLLRWDARSVWFFHAKMIWTEGALRQADGWNHPSVNFASPDYPNLVPALAAQLGSIKGYWNEFIPKGSLLLVLVPLVLWVFSFRRATLSFGLLVALFFFSLDGWLSSGYMDPYLALYGGVALLALGRYADELRETDLYSGVCALGIVAGMKNEGSLFAVCAIFAVLLVGLRREEVSLPVLARRLRTDRTFVAVVVVSAAPTLLWTLLKKAWGLESHVIVSGGWERLTTRLMDGVTPQYLLRFLAARATVAWLLAGLVVVCAVFLRRYRVRPHPGVALASAASAFYFSAMYAVYLITPANLTWHLLTSATRVMATVSFGLLIAIFFMLRSLEGPAEAPADG